MIYFKRGLTITPCCKYLLVVAILILYSLAPFSKVFGQVKDIDQSVNGWYFMINDFKLTERWSIGSELHFRRAEVITSWQQFLFRPSINYKLTDHSIATVGYTYIRSYPYGEQPLPTTIPENNLWQQITLDHTAGKVGFSHRYRLEERFIGQAVATNNGGYEIDGTQYRQRFRYRLTAKIPLYVDDAGIARFFLLLFDEVWFNLEDNFLPNNFDQNWLYGALGFQFNPQGNVQVGMMDQYISKGDGIHYERNPTFQLALFYNLDFSHP